MSLVDRKAVDLTAYTLIGIAKQFKLHLRLAREMYRDGYLRFDSVAPEKSIKMDIYSHERQKIFVICAYYGISPDKFSKLYNAGYISLDGIDLQKTIVRYLQRHAGQLSVSLLCHLAYDELRAEDVRIKAQAAYDYMSALKIKGKLNPPKDLELYLDSACKGQPEALERVARWMRDMIETAGRPHIWAFYGVRLALVEGAYDLGDRPIPKLRKWPKRRKLARLLREHHLLRGCVTPVAKPGRNSEYFYMFHRPGEFWDL